MLIWLVGAALEIAHIDTGWMVIDEFAARFVYFYTGYIFARHVFAFTARAQARPLAGAAGLVAVGPLQRRRWSMPATRRLPFISLALGLIGACRGGRRSRR